MYAYIIDPNTLLVPFRAEAEDGTIGDGMVEIGPDHPGFANWLKVARPLPESWRQAREEARRDAEKAAEYNARQRAKRAELRAQRAAQQSGSISKASGSPSRKSRAASSAS